VTIILEMAPNYGDEYGEILIFDTQFVRLSRFDITLTCGVAHELDVNFRSLQIVAFIVLDDMASSISIFLLRALQ